MISYYLYITNNRLDTNKYDKVNEPVSGRVRHAAEEVLNLLFKSKNKDSQLDERSFDEMNLGNVSWNSEAIYFKCQLTENKFE